MKIAMLRLRNRVLNRFKSLKTKNSSIKSQIITKKVKSPLGLVQVKKTLRVVPNSVLRKSPRLVSVKTSPQKKSKPSSPISKLNALLVAGGLNRIHLRNRRLMAMPKI